MGDYFRRKWPPPRHDVPVVTTASKPMKPKVTVVPLPTAALSGTATASITEADIVAGGKTIILTLNSDTWLTFDDTIRAAIVNGLDAASSPANGWNDDVITALLANLANVVRTNATVCTITLPAVAGYDISSTETITATIPATALTGGVAVVATPAFSVSAGAAVNWTQLGALPRVLPLTGGFSWVFGPAASPTRVSLNSGIFSLTFQASQGAGSSPNVIYFPLGGDYRGIKLNTRFKLPSNWVGEPILKLFMVYFTVGGGSGKSVPAIYGTSGDLTFQHRTQNQLSSGTPTVGSIEGAGGPPNWNYNPSAAGAVIRNQYMDFQAEIFANSAGQTNGGIRHTLDGTVVLQVPGISWDATGPAINEVTMVFVYGGGGTPAGDMTVSIGDGTADNGMVVAVTNDACPF